MPKDLTTSAVDRQNVLNNPYALAEIERAAAVQGVPFEGKSVLLKEQVAAFFEVTTRTIDNYIDRHGDELLKNGYEVLRGARLKALKASLTALRSGHETDFVTKTTVLGVFDFRAFLNLAMLVSESERAKLLRLAAFFSAYKFHCFQDGNKRIAITLAAQMLLFNGYLYCAGSFLRAMENISYHVAAGNISKDLLRDLIAAHLADEMDDEGLKLRLLEAISGDEAQ